MQAMAVENSGNTKLGMMSTTHASLQSCPKDCPFLRAKACYAMHGPLNIIRNRLMEKRANCKQSIAEQEARAIDGLSGRWPLRIHTMGDCSTPEAARTVSRAAERFMAKHGETAYTYTHSWKMVPRAAWGKVSVLASCETPAEAKQAAKLGYVVAMVVSDFAKSGVHNVSGVKILPCLKQTEKTKSCLECGMCMKEKILRKSGLAIGFKVHGPTVRAGKMLAGKVGEQGK